MPRKTVQSKTTKSAENSKKEPKPVKTKTAKTTKSTENSKKEHVNLEEKDVSHVEESSLDENSNKNKRVPTRETLNDEFDDLLSLIDEEIQHLRESSGKSKGVKFLRSIGKRVKFLRSHTARVMKQKQKTNRKNNSNSGFLKPVQISKEMAKFTGWDPSQLRSRVDVTKYICKYIRDNNLQNPDDRRQIVADKKLAKLLDYDSSSADKPLTYYRIQSYMKKHFTNPSKSE